MQINEAEYKRVLQDVTIRSGSDEWKGFELAGALRDAFIDDQLLIAKNPDWWKKQEDLTKYMNFEVYVKIYDELSAIDIYEDDDTKTRVSKFERFRDAINKMEIE